MKVVLFGGSARVDEFRDALRAFPGVDLVAADAPADLRAALAGAEILLAGNRRYTPENAAIIRAAGTSLRWIQFTTSGIDKARDSGLPPGVVVTNMAGMRAFAVAEHAMFLMLGVMRNVRATEKARAAEDWCRDAVTPSLGNLAGKHLVVIGLGAIAREVARKAKAFDMKVSAVTRSTETVDHVDALLPRSALCAACAQADIVLLSALYDDSADKMFGREAIAAMRPSAVFVNIARGRLVDEAALVEALAARRIAGAGIDVAVDEPLPPDHAFWHMDNVLLTPHIGGAGGKG
ncbi:MAG TPA: NAD(P)-dependent oxidoreductase, partial [Beijerinckiaceae bacterium]|nr:NAD(P)-dependent oxidoreductase [Beijerinckiaceae bacterium]